MTEPIEVTDRAARKVGDLVEERGLEGHGVRVSVEYEAGEASFKLEFAEEPEEDDVVTESKGVAVYVDGDSVAAVEGSKVDYVVERGRAGFKVLSPMNDDGSADFDDSIEGRIKEFLALNFPQIQGHGGEAVIEEIEEESGYVRLSLEGACSGCGISDATSTAIQNNMPAQVEGVSEVEISAGDGATQIDPPV
ncbi:MAG: NifU family protein [Halobacteriales archaeon]